MSFAIAILCLVAVSYAQPTYLVSYVFVAGCNSNVLLLKATQTTCTPGQGQCTGNTRTSCIQGLPGIIAGGVSLAVYPSGDASCGQNPLVYYSWVTGICVQDGPVSYMTGCNSVGLYLAVFTTNNVCWGVANFYQYGQGGCAAIPVSGLPFNVTNAGYVSVACNGICFHESSAIASPVTGETMTLASLEAKKHPECAVPHKVSGAGVAITTDCSVNTGKPLRLSADHLVYTERGLLAAANVKVGDTLFGDKDRTKLCPVRKVETQLNQRYFALNCEDSQVMADGHLTSTFGTTHTIPALWMRVMSKIVGVERASSWGDKIASIAFNWGLI